MGGKEHGVKETSFTVSQVLKGEMRRSAKVVDRRWDELEKPDWEND